MKNQKRYHAFAGALACLPLVISLSAGALLLQSADARRSVAVPDDALPASLLQFIHPGALACLLVGLGLSLGVLAAFLYRLRRCRAACRLWA